MTDATPAYGVQKFYAEPIPCGGCGHAPDFMCYRCRKPLCHGCYSLGGGWCLPCLDTEARKPQRGRG